MTLPERPNQRPVPDQPGRRASRAETPASWETTVEHVRRAAEHSFYRNVHDGETPPASETILYIVNAPRGATAPRVVVEIARRVRTKAGTWGKPKTARLTRARIEQLADPADRRIISLLAGAAGPTHADALDEYRHIEPWASLPPDLATLLLPMMAATGRLVLRVPGPKDLAAVRWDDGPPWVFRLAVRTQGKGQAQHYELTGWLRRGEERVPVTAARLVAQQTVFFDQVAALLDDAGAWNWLVELRRTGRVLVPVEEGSRLLERLSELPELPPVDLPEGLQVESRTVRPVPTLHIHASTRQKQVTAVVSFDYAGRHVPADNPRAALYDTEHRVLTRRETGAEREALDQLQALGFQRRWRYATDTSWHEVDVGRLPRAIRALVIAGWRVEAEGKLYRSFGRSRLSVRSGIDWFELHGEVDFGDQVAHAARAADGAVARRAARAAGRRQLRPAARGVAAAARAARRARRAAKASTSASARRRRRCSTRCWPRSPRPTVDAGFEQARARPAAVRARRAARTRPTSFAGELRGYQRDGLGWLRVPPRSSASAAAWPTTWAWARRCRCSRCWSRDARPRAASRPPVAGRRARSRSCSTGCSEAERFTPGLRVARLHRRRPRRRCTSGSTSIDLVLTTYGTLRRDAPRLEGHRVRLRHPRRGAGHQERRARRRPRPRGCCTARHRLALSGTPIENHLGELWSLFEFLNPGMLGVAAVLPSRRRGLAAANAGERGRRDRCWRGAAAVHPAAHEGAGGAATCRRRPEADALLRAGARAAAGSTTSCATHYRATLLGADRDGRAWPSRRCTCSRRCCGCGRRPAIPGCSIRRGARTSRARSWTRCCRSSTRCVDEGHKALVFSQFTSLLAHRAAAARRRRASPTSTSTARRATAQARVRAVPERPGVPAVPDQPEGRRPRA